MDRIYLLWNKLTVLCHLDFEQMYHIITEIVQSTMEHKRKMILNKAQAQADSYAS